MLSKMQGSISLIFEIKGYYGEREEPINVVNNLDFATLPTNNNNNNNNNLLYLLIKVIFFFWCTFLLNTKMPYTNSLGTSLKKKKKKLTWYCPFNKRKTHTLTHLGGY